jgi:ribose transport system substrate-binding protein
MQAQGDRTRRRAATIVAAFAVAATALAACSSSGSGSSGGGPAGSNTAGSGAAGSTGSASSCVTQAAAGVAASQKPITAQIPTQPVDVSKAKGKVIWDIEFDSSVPLSNDIATGVRQAAASAGMTVKNFDGKGQVALWNQGVSEAVSQHAGAILLNGFVPSLVETPFKAALAAKIPVIDSMNGNPGDPLNGLFAHVTGQFTLYGAQMADLALQKTNCKADIAIFTSTELATLVDMDKGAQAEVTKLCGSSCKTAIENVAPASIATAAGPLAQNVIRRDPKINFVIAQYDALGLYVVPALQQANSKVPLVSQTGSEANLQFVKDGKQYANLAFPDNRYIGWLVVDEMVRALSGQPAVQEDLPAQLLLQGDSFSPSNPFPNFGDYATEFKKLWGVTS